MSGVSAIKKAKKRPANSANYNKHGMPVSVGKGPAATKKPRTESESAAGAAAAAAASTGSGGSAGIESPTATASTPNNNSHNNHALEEPWTVEDSANLYHVHGWGAPYFAINEEGHIEVDPSGDPESKHKIDLYELVEDVVKRGMLDVGCCVLYG